MIRVELRRANSSAFKMPLFWWGTLYWYQLHSSHASQINVRVSFPAFSLDFRRRSIKKSRNGKMIIFLFSTQKKTNNKIGTNVPIFNAAPVKAGLCAFLMRTNATFGSRKSYKSNICRDRESNSGSPLSRSAALPHSHGPASVYKSPSNLNIARSCYPHRYF